MQIITTPTRTNKKPTLEIIGEDFNYEQIMHGTPSLNSVRERNLSAYLLACAISTPEPGRKAKPYQAAYCPSVQMRLTYERKNSGKYFTLITNTSRDQRPCPPSKKEPLPVYYYKDDDTNDPLQKHIVIPKNYLGEFKDYYVSINQYPISFAAGILIGKELKRQGDLELKDLEQLIQFSCLTGLVVGYNGPYAGASVNRNHAQLFYKDSLRLEGETVTPPLFNGIRWHELNEFTKEVRNNPADDSPRQYPLNVVVFKPGDRNQGRDPATRAYKAIKRILEDGKTFNLVIDGKEVYVFARNPDKCILSCTGKAAAFLECTGDIVLGHVTEQVQRQSIVTTAADICNNLSYYEVFDNLADSSEDTSRYIR